MVGEASAGVVIAEVCLDPKAVGTQAEYTYAAAPETPVGGCFFVSIGSRSAIGFVVAVWRVDPVELGFPVEALKPLGRPVVGMDLPPTVVALARWISQTTLCPLPVALSAAIPPGVRDRLATFYRPAEGPVPPDLTALELETLRALRDEGEIVEKEGADLAPATLKRLRALVKKGAVASTVRVLPYATRAKPKPSLRVTADVAAIDRFLKTEGRRKPAQALTLIRLQDTDEGSLTWTEAKALAQVTDTTLKALLNAGLLLEVDTDTPHALTPAPTPNALQAVAIGAIVDAVEAGRFEPFLLHGVTGAGKTEVYLRAAAEALRQGRQVLFLVPEIALATQAIGLLRARFGPAVALLHSDLPAGERLETWLRIRSGEVGIVLGARSALFAPLDRIGLILVDEEHEGSYKQESMPRYHARTAALRLGEEHGCPVVLGSATPSVESYHLAEAKEAGRAGLTLLSLPTRAASAMLPTVEIDDLTAGFRIGQPSILGKNLRAAMGEALGQGRQCVLFLNRRAYAPFILCRDCGHRMVCPNCAVALSYHRRSDWLKCHHCGYQIRPPEACPECASTRLKPVGIGTEKVEEEVAAAFPEARVARLDRDVAQKRGALEEVLADFRSGETDILIGTQMVAKGLDFPNVTLVGVIAADISLNIPDFRSSERTFQLLSQVAGRAGRGQHPGRVIIQTFNPQHPAVTHARDHDFIAFFEALREERREAVYPPFCQLVNLVFSGPDRKRVVDLSARAAEALRNPDWTVLGPVDCPLERVQNAWRRHCLLKLPLGADVGEIARRLQGIHDDEVQTLIDVDPYSLM